MTGNSVSCHQNIFAYSSHHGCPDLFMGVLIMAYCNPYINGNYLV